MNMQANRDNECKPRSEAGNRANYFFVETITKDEVDQQTDDREKNDPGSEIKKTS